MKVSRFSLVLASAIAATGCASIISDNQYSVSVTSTPPGAEYSIKNRDGYVIEQGQTPSTVSLRSSAGFFTPARYTVSLHKDGFQDREVELKAGIDGWYFGNIVLGGALGMLFVDPATGAMWSLPEVHSTSLDALAVAEAEPAAAEPVMSAPVDAESVVAEPEPVMAKPAMEQGVEEQPAVSALPAAVKPVAVDATEIEAAEVEAADFERDTPKQAFNAEVVVQDEQQLVLVGKPVGYDAATRVAEANNCSSYIALDYAANGGAIYSTSCSKGPRGMIKCELDNCRMME